MKETVAVSGDMTADSTGQTANSGCYVMMDFEDEKILDLQLVQRDEVDSSTNLETEGLKSCLHFLESKSVKVDSVVTQSHPEVEEYLEERDTPLYFDVWRVAEGLSKRLGSVAKQKDCEVVQRWLPGIKNHLYWTASSSQSGAEKVAKWTSLVNHIQDVHTHDDPLYPKCAHPIKVSRDPNKWFKPGSVALNKVKKILLNKKLLHTVSKLSSDHQSSALDSFHNLIPYFAPKKRLFPFNGMLCRHYLAAMHHNENAKRERALSKEKLLWKLLLSKSEKCQARVLKQEATFGYRNDLMLLVLNEVQGDPVKFQKAMQKVPVPPPPPPRANGPSQEHPVDNKVSGVNTAVPSTGTSYVVTKVSWGNTAVPAVGRLYTDKLSEVSATMPAADRPYVDDMASEFDTPVPAVGRPYLVQQVSEVNTAGPAVGRLYTNDKLSEFSATMPATDSPYEDDMVSEFDTAVPATDRPYLIQKVSEVNTAVAAVGRPYLFQKVSEAHAAVPGSEMDEPRQTSFLQDQSSTEES